MKIWYVECTEEELRANRGIMDSVVDAMQGMFGSIYGTYNPFPINNIDTEEPEEDKKEVEE